MQNTFIRGYCSRLINHSILHKVMENRLYWPSGSRDSRNFRRKHSRGYQRGMFYGMQKRSRSKSYHRDDEDDSCSNSGNYQLSNSRGNKESRQRLRHPPGLKGKEIGLWYARKSQKKKEKNMVPLLSMNNEKVEAINNAIDGIANNMIGEKFDEILDLASGNFSNEGGARECDESFYELVGNISDSDFKSAYLANLKANRERDEGLICTSNILPKLVKESSVDQKLFEDFSRKQEIPKYQEMLAIRKNLPSFKMQGEILDIIKDNQVVVISGETGCGKTTQVAQFLLDDCIMRHAGSECRIVCTQPRRISAISVAERVAEERAEDLGVSVGYQIRLESKLPHLRGSILYCTTGIVLQWLQSDPLLSSVSHLILDEIHERDTLSDFLVCIAKELISLRPDLKVILMSATLNASQFSSYFLDCPTINIPGFTFDVKEYYLEDVLSRTRFSFPLETKERDFYRKRRIDNLESREFNDYIMPYLRNLESTREYESFVINELKKKASEELNMDLVLSLLKHISSLPAGAVLVFVPGWEQISKLTKMVQNDRILGSAKFLVIPLHSLMPTVSQKQVFDSPPPGVRKIIIATNIAETSITINDIVYVVDTGRIKIKNYDRESNLSTLLPEWITRANARQRRGRAGRVQEGVCFHLYTKVREQLMDSFLLPEIKRTHLAEVILQVKNLHLGSTKDFLSKVMESPEEEVIDKSIKMLEAIGALDSAENLTPLGFHLARLPMDPLTGKMILMGAIFSCLGPVLTVASSLSFKDPFVMVLGKEKLIDRVRLRFSGGRHSDHLMLVNVFEEWQAACRHSNGSQFAWNNFLSSAILNQLKNMRVQFMNHLNELKFVNTRNPDAREVNLNSKNIDIVKAVITAGLYPNVGRIVNKMGGRNKGNFAGLSLHGVRKALFHPKSVNSQEKRFKNSWVVYWEMIKTTKVFLYDSTEISNYPLLLFGEKFDYDENDQTISVDSFVKIRCDKRIADVIKKLRKELDDVLEYKVSHPGVADLSSNSRESRLLSLIADVLCNESSHSDEDTNYYNDLDYD